MCFNTDRSRSASRICASIVELIGCECELIFLRAKMKHKSDKLSALKFVPKPIDFKEIQETIGENLAIFKDSEIFLVLEKIYYVVDSSEKLSSELESAAREYDFDENTHGNGYWSLNFNLNAALKNVLKICKQMTKKRDKLLFNKKNYVK